MAERAVPEGPLLATDSPLEQAGFEPLVPPSLHDE